MSEPLTDSLLDLTSPLPQLVKLKDAKGRTPLDVAKEKANALSVRLLQKVNPSCRARMLGFFMGNDGSKFLFFFYLGGAAFACTRPRPSCLSVAMPLVPQHRRASVGTRRIPHMPCFCLSTSHTRTHPPTPWLHAARCGLHSPQPHVPPLHRITATVPSHADAPAHVHVHVQVHGGAHMHAHVCCCMCTHGPVDPSSISYRHRSFTPPRLFFTPPWLPSHYLTRCVNRGCGGSAPADLVYGLYFSQAVGSQLQHIIFFSMNALMQITYFRVNTADPGSVSVRTARRAAHHSLLAT